MTMSMQQGKVILELADSEDDAWGKVSTYLKLLQRAGITGAWSVRAERNTPPGSREGARGRTGGGSWRVVLYDERGAGGESIVSLTGLLRLKHR